MAGAQKSVMGNITFYEMNQTHMGAAIHQYQSTCANKHLLCVLSGRFTPDQRTIARNKALIDTSLCVDVISWFIRASGHWAYRNLPLPSEAPEVIILEDDETQNNTDNPQNPDVENQYEGSTFTFTSSYDPNENTGTFQHLAEFASALMNNASPLLLVKGGRYINGKDLRLDSIPF